MKTISHKTCLHLSSIFIVVIGIFFLCCSTTIHADAQTTDFDLKVTQITFGEKHHLFGYIGQSKTIPWNANGRYIVGMRTDFHDRLAGQEDEAEIIVIDTKNGYDISVIDKTRGWNHQQGTMLYWNPYHPETQFFFNDRDSESGKVFTVLYDIDTDDRIKEYRFSDTPVGNSGVAPGGGSFLAINYARMARLRPVTGYRGATDWTTGVPAPEDDGIFIIDIESGKKKLLVSFRQLAEALRPDVPDIDEISLFINHTLWNRTNDRIWFFVRGNWGRKGTKINASFTIQPDGTGLTRHIHIGGHPEWGDGPVIIGIRDGRQIMYDVNRKEIVGELGTPSIFPDPEGDISYSPDGAFFVNGYDMDGYNYYTIYRLKDGAHVTSVGLSRGAYTRGDLRIDPAPRWNRTSDAILVPGWTRAGTRQLHVISIEDKSRE